MKYFVEEESIVRKIWGKSDYVLFIFAGAAAEFALNKSVDWLFFTGRLPEDPLGRMFSTIAYARKIVFSDEAAVCQTIDKINSIHKGVETKRGFNIPNEAFIDVLYMLIDYSIRSFELFERKLTEEEKKEIFDVFHRVGIRMNLEAIPASYEEWKIHRVFQLGSRLEKSQLTDKLFLQYKKHLGGIRYKLLVEAQLLVVPEKVKLLMGFGRISMLKPVVPFYILAAKIKLEELIKSALLPSKYKSEVDAIDRGTINKSH